MAIAIKSVPILLDNASVSFNKEAELALKKKASIKFSKEIELKSKIILKSKINR